MILKDRREEKGYTQQYLASMVGVTQTAISLIESGERCPSVPLAKRIAKLLEFEWTEMYEEQPDGDEAQ